MSKVISGEGSYTLVAWIVSDSVETSSSSVSLARVSITVSVTADSLHQAHWGADTNGATNLNDHDASANDG